MHTVNPSQPTQQPPQTPLAPPTTTKKTNGLAIVGFVLAFLAPLIGFILSIIGLVKAKNYGGSGKGLSIAGIVISVILLPFVTLFWLLVIVNVTKKANEAEPTKTTVSQTSELPKGQGFQFGKIYTEKSGA